MWTYDKIELTSRNVKYTQIYDLKKNLVYTLNRKNDLPISICVPIFGIFFDRKMAIISWILLKYVLEFSSDHSSN